MHDTVVTFDTAPEDSALSVISRLGKAELRVIAAKTVLSSASWCFAVGWNKLEDGAQLGLETSFALGFLVLLLTLFLAAASAALGLPKEEPSESWPSADA